MIISASYKTDIPTFYGEWFMRRLDAGYCKMVNPFLMKRSMADMLYGAKWYRFLLFPAPVDASFAQELVERLKV